MKHCIQINIGSSKYAFDIEVKKEADLTASFPDIIAKYILKDKNNIDKLREITELLETEQISSSHLKKVLNKQILENNDISELLTSYTGNTSIYNIASYFNAAIRSDKLSVLSNILKNRILSSGSKANTASYDVIIMEDSVNRIITNNHRNLLILNPNTDSNEAVSLLATIYALTQLREPNSVIFNKFKNILLEYSGELSKDIKNLSMMDKIIYTFSNPNLEPDIREQFNTIINQDLSAKWKVWDKVQAPISNQEDALFDMMVDDRNKIITNGEGTIGVSITQIINFKNGLWNAKTGDATEDEFKTTFGLEEIDRSIYPINLWGYLIKHKDVAEIIYDKMNRSQLSSKSIFDKIKEASRLLLIDNISFEDSDVTVNIKPEYINIESGTKFEQNRMIKLRYDINNIDDKTLIISNKAKGIEFNGGKNSVAVSAETALTNKEEILKLLKKYNIFNIKFESNIPLSTSEVLLKTFNTKISHLTIKNNTDKDVEYVLQANALGYQVNLYNTDQLNKDVLNKYTSIMPVYVKPLAAKYKPLSYQSDVFNRMSKQSTLVPVLSSNYSLIKYPIGESFKLYNEKNPDQTVGVTLANKIPLYHQYYTRPNTENIETGDLITKTGRRYIFISIINQNTIKAIDINTTIPETVIIHTDYIEPVIQNDLKIVTPVNDSGIVWFKDYSGKEAFYDMNNDTFLGLSRLDYFESEVEEWSENSGIPKESIHKLLRDNKKRLFFELSPSKYEEHSVVYGKSNNSKIYYTTRDLVERINTRLSKGTIPVIWFNSKSTKAELGFSIKNLKHHKAFTHNGIIYMNEDLSTIDSYVHELSHIILTALRTQDVDAYNILLSKVNDIPTEFANLYEGLTANDLREEYLVHLFSNHFTNVDQSAISDTMSDLDWGTVVKDIFKLSNNTDLLEIVNLMNSTIGNMLASTEDSSTYSRIYKDNKFLQLTKLAALKKELMSNNNLKEEC